MILKVKLLGWSAGTPVGIIHRKLAARMNIHVSDRVILEKVGRKIICITDLSDTMIKKDEIAVSSEVLEALKLEEGELLKAELTDKPKSIYFIHKKLLGKTLTQEEIKIIINDIVSNALTQAEIAYFVSGVFNNRMNKEEIIDLTESMVDSGVKLDFDYPVIADKHSIGGIAGNRTTPIIVSICAAAGLIIPKTSSRAITAAAGTADVVEVLSPVEFSASQLKEIVKKTNACLAWGGSLGMAPADDKLIQVERLLNVDPEPQLLASIMSKKIAAGSTHIIIDIPFGKSAKVESKAEAKKLKKQFEDLGDYFNMKVKAVLTDGRYPIGNGVGPVMEIRDILKILKQDKSRPLDLEKKSLLLAAELLELTKKSKSGKGYILSSKILKSGEAFKKFKEIIKAQGGIVKQPSLAKFKKEIIADKNFKITSIDNKKINELARLAGSPADKKAGLYLNRKIGKVKKGDIILTIYSESGEKLKNATEYYFSSNPLEIK